MCIMRRQHLCMCMLAALILLFAAGCGDDQSTQHSDGDVDQDINDTTEDSEDGDITEQETDVEVDEDKPAESESDEEDIADGDSDGDTDSDTDMEAEVEAETAGPPPLPGFEGFSAAGGTMQGQGMLLHFSFAPARIGSATRATNGSMTLKSVVTPAPLPPQP